MISFQDKIDPYAPCYCGSGKKYRFCCQNRTFDVSAGSFLTADEKRYEKAKQLHAKGYALMSEHKYEEAIEQFKRSLELRPDVPNPVNNLALCHFILGNVDEALAEQRDYLKKYHFLPAFGLANLAMFLYFKDEMAAAVNTLYIAASQDIVSRDAALKICEIFARLHRYKDLYDFIFSRPDVDEPDFAFFAGVAAVNVGDSGHAVEYLRRVPDHDPKIVIARDFLKHLKAGTRPQSLRGDWPIFPPGEFYMTPYLKDKSDTNPILKTLWLVDFVEACINDPDYRKMNECLDLLRYNQHPEAGELLKKIVSGDIGTDERRSYAAHCMLDRGNIKSGEVLEMQMNGTEHPVKELTIDLDPDYELCPLPDKIARDYTKTVIASHAEKPDWKRLAERYKAIFSRCPSFFPAEFNYAAALRNCGDDSGEAEKIARRLVLDHPEYLFAHAMLLNILTEKACYEEGMQLIRAVEIPKKMHPDTWNEWLVAQFRFYLAQGKSSEAKAVLDALEIVPDKDPLLAELKEQYEIFCSLRQILNDPDMLRSQRRQKKEPRSRKRK